MKNHLTDILNGEYILSIQLKNAHWNMESENFIELHKFLDKEYDRSTQVIDLVAERIRQHGDKVEININTISESNVIDAGLLFLGVTENRFDMLHSLIQIYTATIALIKWALSNCPDDDYTCIDLLSEILRNKEKSLWILNSSL